MTIQCNLKIVNYLDVTFNLSKATLRSICKTNNEMTYIHKESNHPPVTNHQSAKLKKINNAKEK